MDKAEIPRFGLDTFTQNSFKEPFLNVEHYPPDANYFVIRNRDEYPVKDYISPNRRQFYKIFHITSGTGVLTVGLHRYLMSAGDIAFLHPDEIMSWQVTSKATGGHFCLVHPHYFNDAAHLLQLFRNYPYFKASKAVIQLDEAQSARTDQFFRLMLQEDASDNHDRKHAILLHLQMILLEARRAGRNLADVEVPENYRYIYGFLSLLEAAFQVQGPAGMVKMRTAAEFAGQLHLHPNYLNALVKQQTGKTLREHIQERLLYEAKTLLIQTDWDIKAISHALGFAEQAAFTSFFSKKEQMTPSLFRETAAIALHI